VLPVDVDDADHLLEAHGVNLECWLMSTAKLRQPIVESHLAAIRTAQTTWCNPRRPTAVDSRGDRIDSMCLKDTAGRRPGDLTPKVRPHTLRYWQPYVLWRSASKIAIAIYRLLTVFSRTPPYSAAPFGMSRGIEAYC
jgi:hypothetical protein